MLLKAVLRKEGTSPVDFAEPETLPLLQVHGAPQAAWKENKLSKANLCVTSCKCNCISASFLASVTVFMRHF